MRLPQTPAWLTALLLAAPLAVAAQDTARADTAAVDSVPAPQVEPEPLEAVTDERAALDEAIRNQLQAVFDRVESLSRVDVTVDAGVVTLDGTVLSADTRERAEALASELDGVLFVENRLRESTSLDERLEPTWDRLRDLGYGTVAKLPLLAVALLVLGIAVVLGGLLSRWRGPSFLRTRNPFLQNLIRRAIQGAVVLAGVIVALDLLDATALVGAVVGTAGLAGLALGFAFKDIVENYLAGTILAVRQPFAKNDHIRVEGFEGKVVRLTARETILMTLDGNHVRLPNALIFRSPMLNFTRNPLRRFQFDAGVGAGDDLARARDVAVETLGGIEGVLGDPRPQALVLELGESSVAMRFTGWVDQTTADFNRVRSEALRKVKIGLEDAGLTLPSPEYIVRLRQEGDAAPGKRGPDTPSPEPAPDTDVSVDRTLDEQIEADRRESDEPDLLDENARVEGT